jgi:hypothetical protein
MTHADLVGKLCLVSACRRMHARESFSTDGPYAFSQNSENTAELIPWDSHVLVLDLATEQTYWIPIESCMQRQTWVKILWQGRVHELSTIWLIPIEDAEHDDG